MLKVGDLFSNKYGDYYVTDYINSGKVEIIFKSTGWKYITSASNIRKGLVKDYLVPTVWGKGYCSLGKLPLKKDNPIIHEAYSKWEHMLRRCYSENFLKDNPTYQNSRVDTEWLDFKNFYNWYVSVRKSFMDSSWNLDKDLLYDYKNSNYSSETCALIPSELNRLITGVRTKRKPKLR